MNSVVKCLIVLSLAVCTSIAQSQTIEEYIKKAENYQESNKLEEAVQMMEEAVKKFPDNSTTYSYLGLFTGMQAGRTSDFMEAGQLVQKSFELLNKAVSLDSDNPFARYHRGIMGINVPEFLGKLDIGVRDLEVLIDMSQKSPGKISNDMLVDVYNLLGQGYQKKKDKQQAKLAWEKVIELVPGTQMAENAENQINKLETAKKQEATIKKVPDTVEISELKQKVKQHPENSELLLQLGEAYITARNFDDAATIFKKTVKIDSSNVKAYKLLIQTLGELAARGYDERIYEDTDLRTNIAFEVTRLLDKAYALAPDDIEIKLTRAIAGVQMPFFVGKLDLAMEDLNGIINSDAPDSTRAEALYWLGAAYQKKAMTNWIKVVSDYSNSLAAQSVFEIMRPPIKHIDLSKYEKPFVVIDFVLGFRDELPPQTAVWVETKEGEFVKTIYVSGFSGYAKEQQANLSDWAESSNFSDADAVTGASIDVGHHIYIWNLKDCLGKTAKSGEYIIRVEVAYWPSMEYQSVSANIKLEKKEARVVVEQGNLIPYVEVKYFPSEVK